MASNSNRRSGSSGRSTRRKKVIITAHDTSRVRNSKPQREVKERVATPATRRGDATVRASQKVASKKREERERRLRQQRRKLYLKLTLSFIAVAAVVFGVVAIYQSDAFLITTVRVSGNVHLTESEVESITALPARATLLRFPGQEMRERLVANPWIAFATVTRDFPDTVSVSITERTPVALVDIGESSFWLVDSQGYMIAQSAPATDTALVVIRDVVGLDPRAGKKTLSEPLLNALAVWRRTSDELKTRVRAISAPSIDKTALITADDIEIFVGDAEDMEMKDAVVLRILEEQAGNVVYINVRTVDRPTWRSVKGE